MRSAGAFVLRLIVIVVSIVIFCVPDFVSAQEGTEVSSSALKKQLKKARKDEAIRSSLRIEADGMLTADVNWLTLYGRGIGIWNNQKQFAADSKTIDAAIDLLLKAEFPEMPARFAWEDEKDERPKPVKVQRLVTVIVGDLKKTVVQDDRGPLSEPFANLTSKLVALCRESAAAGIGAENLADGLTKVAKGTLGPETLRISVNAPQMKSLESQAGQGWLLDIRHGRLTLTSNILNEGLRPIKERPLTDREGEELAKKLLEKGAAQLPPRINTTGYTHLTVTVLDQEVRTMARTFAGKPNDEEKAAAKTFAGVREELYGLFQEGGRELSED